MMLRPACFLLLALVISACPLPPTPLPSSTVPGVYHARTAAADGSARVVTLWLQPGGKATLETVDLGKERVPAASGTWAAQGEQVAVTLDGESEPLVLSVGRDELTVTRWDRTIHGESGLTLKRRTQ
jgi:hypothetical protein